MSDLGSIYTGTLNSGGHGVVLILGLFILVKSCAINVGSSFLYSLRSYLCFLVEDLTIFALMIH